MWTMAPMQNNRGEVPFPWQPLLRGIFHYHDRGFWFVVLGIGSLSESLQVTWSISPCSSSSRCWFVSSVFPDIELSCDRVMAIEPTADAEKRMTIDETAGKRQRTNTYPCASSGCTVFPYQAFLAFRALFLIMTILANCLVCYLVAFLIETPISVPTTLLPETDLSRWTLACLKSFCEQHGLKKSGKKADVLERYWPARSFLFTKS